MAKKREIILKYAADYHLNAMPIGKSVPELEPIIIEHMQRFYPDLKVLSIVFDKKWEVIRRTNDR